MYHVHICRIFFIDESSDLEFSLYSNTLHNVFVKIYIYIHMYNGYDLVQVQMISRNNLPNTLDGKTSGFKCIYMLIKLIINM